MHGEALTSRAAALLPRFAQLKNFYLVGGSALALQIGHRISVDFDFFRFEALPPGLFGNVKRIFPDSRIAVTYRAPEQLNVLIDDIKTTFFHFPYRIIEPFVPYKGINLANVREIAAMKAFSIGKRLAYKDYIDWYFLLQEKRVALAEVIALAKKKFGDEFSDRLFLGQLVSLRDIPSQKIDFLRAPVARGAVTLFLAKAVRGLNL
ncbi:MAG: nucleotidyl transferase AbiEii/AbiGii toxin family protein [Candidatus Liptonbacteria bacterium]|nr:nucleotidyl transferase AbiEii/AbiGii toxin family protein [Candidatus Liptonbacteria bacterium]